MDQYTKDIIIKVLEAISTIDGNTEYVFIREWYPRREGGVAFRLAKGITVTQPIYLEWPANFTLSEGKEEVKE